VIGAPRLTRLIRASSTRIRDGDVEAIEVAFATADASVTWEITFNLDHLLIADEYQRGIHMQMTFLQAAKALHPGDVIKFLTIAQALI
jgi:hypothetical protein